MIKLIITAKNNYVYDFRDENDKNYTLNLEFLDLNEEVKVGDYICINDQLLDKNYDGYSTSYTFGGLESKYGKTNILMDDVDVIKVGINDKEIFLKRLYG